MRQQLKFGRRNDIPKSIGVLIIGLTILLGCVQKSTSYPDTMPNDFNFVLDVGHSSYVLDTYNNKLTKAIDWELDTTISYQLPLNERQRIYKILKNIDIYKYPENYAPTSTVTILPTAPYVFEFTLNGVDSKINWEENTESETKDAKELRKLFFEVVSTFEKDGRVKSLPESKRAFL
ncbi:MAG TPA: hypothetical protein VFC65_01265 [Prolixibacteraceae bacterium]|nr:hypothetical protein [Prolixibacteraceae bacterium]